MTRAASEGPLVGLLGYDRGLFARLSPECRSHVARACEGATVSAFLLAAPPGYVAWLLTHMYWAAALTAVCAFVFVINLVRLTTAGGGRAARDQEAAVRAHRPSLTPLVLLGMLAALFAQPAQLPLWNTELAPVLVHERARLLAAHQDARPVSADYARELAECEFLVLRLRTIWLHPGAAARLSALYLALVILPMLLTRSAGLRGLAAYELVRWREQRAVVRADAARTHAATVQALSRFSGYQPRAGEDPFSTRFDDPLRTAWRKGQSSAPVPR